MRRLRTFAGLVAVCVCVAGYAFASPETDATLQQLSNVRLQKKIYSIRDITVRRDTLSIFFDRGFIAFLEPVMGKVTGAVFIGSGEIVSVLPDVIEKQQMFRFIRSPILNERFTSAFFRFTDGTYDEILKEYSEHAEEDVTAEEAAQFVLWDTVLANRAGPLNYRILGDLLDEVPGPFFMGDLISENHGRFQVVYDEKLSEEVAVVKPNIQADVPPIDTWASYRKREPGRTGNATPSTGKATVDVLGYQIDASISPNGEMVVTADVKMRVMSAGRRMLTFDLSHLLPVSAVTSQGGQALTFYPQRGEDAFHVILPEASRIGQELQLKIAYAGNAMEHRAEFLFMDDRALWYPTVGENDRATFDLTFHYPAAYSLVATGTRVREWTEGPLHHSNWTSRDELPVAGFSLGNLVVSEDTSAAVPVFIAAAKDADSKDALNKVHAMMDYFSRSFGPYPYPTLTVSRMPVTFSRGWPSLVYLPFDETVPADELAEAHQFAHQWFGDKAGVQTYRDQWILEGFANYTAAMYLENKYPDTRRLNDILAEARTRLLANELGGGTYESIGPLSLGQRLASSLAPDGYSTTLFNKATWVVHMLRMLMRGEGSSDEAFLSMIRDFLQSFQGRQASTLDLKQVIEKHMTKAMDVHGDHTMDWFFDEWIFATGVPSYDLTSRVTPSGTTFVVQGNIKQAGVPEGFVMPVAVYADDTLLGRVNVGSDGADFRFTTKTRPAVVSVNGDGTVLTRPE